jgi:hypothetical protein
LLKKREQKRDDSGAHQVGEAATQNGLDAEAADL